MFAVQYMDLLALTAQQSQYMPAGLNPHPHLHTVLLIWMYGPPEDVITNNGH